jgi:hypothetical protein
MRKPTKSFKTSAMPKFAKAFLIFIGSASLASAQVIVSDNFDRNGNLDGSIPVVGNEGGTNKWAVGSDGSPDTGTITTSTTGGGQADSASSTGASTVSGVLAIPTAYLMSPGGSLKDGTYTLSLTMSTPGLDPVNTGVLFGLGAFSNPNLEPWNFPPNNNLGMGSINLRGSGSNAVIFPGPALATYSTLPLTSDASVNFVLTFDVSNSAAWTLSATVNGTPISFGGVNPYVYTYSSIGDPNVAVVGVPSNDLYITQYGATTGTFQSLVFEEVPEPGTYALVLGGFGILLGLYRFRSQRA